MHAAVIVPFLPRFAGGQAFLDWTLEGYRHQQLSSGHSMEVHVGIDGGDPIGTTASGDPFPQFTHYFPRMGAAAVRNALAARIDADVIIFGNADARPEPDMVQQHMETMARLPAGSLVLGSAPWEMPAVPTVFDAMISETPAVFFYNQMTGGEWYDYRHAWTLNLSMRVADFRAAEGFPEELRPVYYEDLALGHRCLGLHKKGIFYHPEARVIHRHPTTLEQYLNREELLGMMAPVLFRACQPAFLDLMHAADPVALGRQFDAWIPMDQRSHRWTYERFSEWAALPESALGAGEARKRLLMTIYQMHIPLKRLAFRLGYCRGLQLAADSHWQERRPHGDWKAIVMNGVKVGEA